MHTPTWHQFFLYVKETLEILITAELLEQRKNEQGSLKHYIKVYLFIYLIMSI